jgi:hypothetical protein
MTIGRFVRTRGVAALAAAVMALAAPRGIRSHQGVDISIGPPTRTAGAMPAGTGLVMGRTIDPATRAPVPGVIVSIRMDPHRPEYVVTDDQGRFVFRDLPKGRLTFSAEKPGYVKGKYAKHLPDTGLDVDTDGQALTLDTDGRAGDLVVFMWKHAAIGGTVLDERGDPVVGITVRSLRAIFAGGRRHWSLDGAIGLTDDRGIYRLSSLIPGDHVVALPVVTSSWPRSLLRLLASPAASSPAGLSDSMSSGLKWIGGGGTTGSGAALRGTDDRFAVVASEREPALAGMSPSGRLLVYETQFYSDAATLSRASSVTLGSGEERSGVDFHLRPVTAVSVSGTLTGTAGPAPNLLLRLVPIDAAAMSDDPELYQTISDADGTFTFLGVAPGEYTIKALVTPRPKRAPLGPGTVVQTAGGSTVSIVDDRAAVVPTEPTLWAETRVGVGDQPVRDVVVTLRQGLYVAGRVELEGAAERPSGDWFSSVYIERADGSRSINLSLLLAPVDARGNFRSFGLTPGKYFVRVPWTIPGWSFRGAMLGDRDVSVMPIDLTDADVEGIVVKFSDKPAGVLSGTVRTDRGPAGPGACVIVFPINRATWGASGENPPDFRSVAVVSGGRYAIEGLPPGEYFLAASAESRVDWSDPQNLDALARSAQRIRTSEGERRTQDVSLALREPSPDQDATLPHGPWAGDETPQTPPRDVRPPAPMGTGVISGVAVDREARPMRQVHVALTGLALLGGQLVITDDTGRFSFDGLPAGRYTLTAARAAYLPVTYGASRPGRTGTPITVTEGQRVAGLTLSLVRGSVITGVVSDERGQPVNGANVQVLQYRTINGERRLVTLGPGTFGGGRLFGEQTDDRGVFRVYGLEAGEYAIGVTANLAAAAVRQVSADDVQFALRTLEQPGARSAFPPPKPAASSSAAPSAVGYAPVFFPGTTDPTQAALIAVGPEEDRSGVDFTFQPVRTAVVSGTIVDPAGATPSNLSVRLLNVGKPAGMDLFGGFNPSPTQPGRDGGFAFRGVVPGQYALVVTSTATGGRATAQGGPMLWATAEVSVAGVDISNLILTLQPGMTITGTVVFEATTLTPPPVNTVQTFLSAVLTGSQVSVGQLGGTVGGTGAFAVTGVMPGRYNLRVVLPAGTSGWLVRSALLGGRDILDEGLDVRPGENVSGVSVTYTDRPAEISGTLQDPSGRPAPDYVIIVFPAEKTWWRPGARRIRQVRPGTDGRFIVNNLIAGQYLIAAATDVEPNEWYDPAFLEQLVAGAVPITLTEGEKKTQDIRIRR